MSSKHRLNMRIIASIPLFLLSAHVLIPQLRAQFINEIHFDYSCPHTTESVQIAFLARQSIYDWSVVLYNGARHTPTRSIDVSEIPLKIISMPGASHWKFIDINLRRFHKSNDGTPYAVALVYNSSKVVNFLSYGNTFIANGGPAHGLECEHVAILNMSTLQHRTSVLPIHLGYKYGDRNLRVRPHRRNTLPFTYAAHHTQETTYVDHHHHRENNHDGEHLSPVYQVFPFINEIHSQNVGWDVYEGVEVAAPAGTSLDGYFVVFYVSRTGNVAGSYRRLRLGGTVRDQSNGWGFIFFRRRRTRNGPRDGLALVDSEGNVMDFLSYGCTIHAVDGPATGLISIDIEVAEQKSSVIGHSSSVNGYSRQRIGKGKYVDDFTWSSPMIQTYGKVNSGQEFVQP